MKRISITAALVLLAALSFAGVNPSAGIMFPILDIGVGARACAMAGAFTAGADDASAVFWNPAGLSGVKAVEIALTYDSWLMSTADDRPFYSHMLIAVPAGPGAVAADVIYVNGGSFPNMGPTGIPDGTSTKVSSIGGLISYGMNIAGGFSAGVTAKFLNQAAGEASNNGMGADIGLLFATGIVKIGVNARNIGTAGSFSMPMSINGGVQIEAVKNQQHSFNVEIDGKYLLKDAPSIIAGFEYTYSKAFSVRAGYSYRLGTDALGGLAGLAAGTGFNLSGVKIDYAFVPYGDLGTSHKATLSYMFGSSQPGSKKTYSAAAIKADVDLTVKEAEELEAKGDLAKAAAKLRDAVLEDQNNAELWKKLGMIYYKDKKKENAIKAFEKYMKLNSSDSLFREWLGKYRK